MSEINVTSLSYVVKSCLADVGYQEGAYYMQFLQWAVNGYREMNLVGLMPTIKTVSIPINQTTMSAPLPKDYIDFIRIGVCCNGIFINFDYNDEICLTGDTLPAACCSSSQIANNISCICNAVDASQVNGQGCCNDANGFGFGGWYWGAFNGWQNYSTQNFGIGPGYYHGGYRINTQLGTIQFDSCVKAQSFTMEYKSSGFDNMGEALIPEGAIPALKEFVHWSRCRFSRGDSPNDRALLRREATDFKRRYLVLMDDFNHRQNALTKFDYLDIFRRYTFLQVKT